MGSPNSIDVPTPLMLHSLNTTDSSLNLQKRKRVTRACDECRKKKVKCDGQQPCIHCTVYSYDCTYDRPTNRKKTSADVHLIEEKLKTSAQVLRLLLPNLEVFDPNFHFDIFQEVFTKQRNSDRTVNLDELVNRYKVKAIEFDATSIGQELIQDKERKSKEKDQIDPLSGSTTSTPSSTAYSTKSSSINLTNNLKSVRSSRRKHKKQKVSNLHPPVEDSSEYKDSEDGEDIKIILPPKSIALEFVTKTWSSPCVLFRFYHRPSFIKDLDELYNTSPDDYTDKQNKFLPLVYSVMAVGALFSKKNGVDDKFLEDEGYRFFVASRKLIDITDARDLYAIQTIVMLILFLQCSARLSTCYSYIGVALRSALREGLHRKVAHAFNPIEMEIRKRLFWTIYKMDIYVNAMLGLPRSIAPEDVDQDMPFELDDENITETGYLPQEPGKLSSAGIANNHTNLILVLNNIVKNLYPIDKDFKIISHEKVSEMELQLRAWLSKLPREMIPGFDPPYQYFKANRLLHLSFLHVQIVLYRPFIHYVSPKCTSQANVDPLSIQRAKNCISVARTVVKLAQDMIKRKMLSGSYWFSVYTIFFSVACLVYYVHEVPFDEFHPDYIGIRHDAEVGKEILTVLKDTSMAGSRIYNILNSLFEQLNRRTVTLHRQREQEENQKDPKDQGSQIRHEHPPYSETSYLNADPGLAGTNNNRLTEQSVPIAQNLTGKIGDNKADEFQPNVITPLPEVNHSTIASPYSNIKMEENLNDFDYLANFDSFINQPVQPLNDTTFPRSVKHTPNNISTSNSFSGVDLESSTYSKNITASNKRSEKDSNDIAYTTNFSQGVNTNETKNSKFASTTTPGSSITNNSTYNSQDYMPGMIDQLDMQIFGRFLPPYMLKRPDGTSGPGPKGGDLPSGLNTTNQPTSLEDLPNLSELSNTNVVDPSANLDVWSELDHTDFSKYIG